MKQSGRAEMIAIGEALIAVGTTAGPVDVERAGDLLVRLAKAFGRYKDGKSASAVALGSLRSDRKAASSRENGKLGGRPRRDPFIAGIQKGGKS